MIEETLLDAIDRMDHAVEHTQSQFATVRTGRATPALVEKLMGHEQVPAVGTDRQPADVVPGQLVGRHQPTGGGVHDRDVSAECIRDHDPRPVG